MERPRRSGVRSIYARGQEEDEKREEIRAVVGVSSTNSHAQRTTRTNAAKSPQKEESKKRPAPNTTSPPAKRGRPPKKRLSASVSESHQPSATGGDVKVKEAKEEAVERRDDEESEEGESSTVRSAFGEAREPLLSQQDIEDEDYIMEDDNVDVAEAEEGEPPSLDVEEEVMGASQQRGLLQGALARRGRPPGSRKSNSFRIVPAAKDAADEEDEMVRQHALHSRHTISRDPRYMFNTDVISDLSEQDVTITELGDKFLKLREGTLPALLKRETILTLIVNDCDRAEAGGWVNVHTPALPPLTNSTGTYIAFVDTKNIEDQKYLTTDGLSPWSSSQPDPSSNLTPQRPKVRKWSVYMRGGEYCVSGDDWRHSLYILVEYSATLPRSSRLRKRVYYVMRDRTLLGLAMLIYDYSEPGAIPSIVASGSNRMYSRQRLEMVKFTDEEGNTSLMGIPVNVDRPRISQSLVDPNEYYDEDFDEIERHDFLESLDEPYDPEHGPFVGEVILSTWKVPDSFVRVVKSNWTADKSLLLKYILNDTGAIPQGAINASKPALPPLITNIGCFATFIKGSQVINYSALNTDALSPWTSTSVRPKTRKIALEMDIDGQYVTCKKDWHLANVVLVETCTILARCPRLRKRIYYVMRNNLTVLGYVLFMYEYLTEGEIPLLQPMHTVRGRSVVGGMARQRPIKFYDELKMEGEMEDSNVDVMDVGEEVEVDLHEEEELDVLEECEMEEDEGEENGGTQDEWMPIDTTINGEIFEPTVRTTAQGDQYMVARTRRLIADKSLVLKYIINDTSYAFDKRIVLVNKPSMPPISSQVGLYIFFVSSEHIDLRAVNRDALSPWSSNDSSDVGKQMRTKVKKFTIRRVHRDGEGNVKENEGEREEKIGVDGGLPYEFVLTPEEDWHTAEYVLVQLHSTLPRCTRLQKKVFYVMHTREQAVLGHVMIAYEYVDVGDPPRPIEKTRRRRMRDLMENDFDGMIDGEDFERDCPFDFLATGSSRDHCVYVPLVDHSFLMDRNRQLHYCVNRQGSIQRNGLLNQSVPLFPPMIAEKGDFVFFVNGESMDARNLTCDGLAPWSDSRLPQATRPKSRKLPVEKARDGSLRYVGGNRWENTPFFLVVYYAVLPRCPRLKKRIIYVCNQSNDIVGNVMIIYSFTEEGQVPQQVPHGNSTTVMQPFFRMPPSLREEAKRMLSEKRPAEVTSVLTERSPSITSRAIYNISKSMRNPGRRFQRYGELEDWMMDDAYYSMGGMGRIGLHKGGHRMGEGKKKRDEYDALYDETGEPYVDVVADNSMEVGHSEEIHSTPFHHTGNAASAANRRGLAAALSRPPAKLMEARRRQRIIDFIQQQAGLESEDETLDYLWRMVVERNERKVLENIRRDFGVEIVTNDFGSAEMPEMEGEVVLEGGVGVEGGDIIVDGHVEDESVDAHPLEEEEVDNVVVDTLAHDDALLQPPAAVHEEAVPP